MEGEGGDPLSVRKNPRIIKAAQEEVATLDVLVCGTCHYVFHFIEAFQEHKNANECGKPTFKANHSESKPQVWAFLLWKSSITNEQKTEGGKDPSNSWKLYQRWCKMAENIRESWIAAGRSIQAFSTIANAKLAEIHSKNAGDTKPRVVTTKAMPLTDDDEDVDDDLRGEEIGGNDGESRPRKMIRKIVRVPIERKDTSPIHSIQNKEVRTYSTKRENSVEMSPAVKIDLDETVTDTNSDTRVGEDTESAIETDKGTEPEAENAEIIKSDEVKVPEKLADNENKDTDTTKETEVVGSEAEKQESKEENKTTNDALNDNMVEIKVEHMSSEEDQNEVRPEPAPEIVKPQVVVPTQRPGTVKRRTLPDGKLGVNRVIRKGEKGKDGEASSEDEYIVERILAKRFNPKRKYYEYLLKWEGYPHEQNTWEPVENMAACDKLVETFERNLARQKAMQQKAATQLSQQKLNPGLIQKSVIKVVKTTAKPDELNQPGPSGLTNFESRPVRSSKKRALEQVKSWCGSMTKKEFETGKRKAGEESDSDDDLAPDKKIKLEPPDEDWSGGEMGTSMNSGVSSDEDSNEKRRHKMISVHGNQTKMLGILHKPVNKIQIGEEVIKRGPGRPPKRFQQVDSSNNTINGITKSKNSAEKDLAVELGLASDSSPEHKSKLPTLSKQAPSSQPPVLVANSKGVIKVDPRQVPNLTSGVYIVSNKSGIVKLNDLPTSPVKAKITSPKVPQGQKISSGMLITGNKSDGIQSGIVRKPFSQPPSGARGALGQATLKQGIAPRTPLSVNSGLVRVTPPGTLNKQLLGSAAGRPSLGSPRLLGPRPSLSSPRPSLSMLSQRPGLMQSLRPNFQPRLSGMPIRPSLSSPGIKRSPLGMQGVQNKITSVRPKTPLQSSLGRGIVRNTSPAAQVKSGMKPIQAMLGKAVQSYGPSSAMTTQQRLILAKKQQSRDTAVLIKHGSGNVLVPSVSVQTKPGVKVDDSKLKKPIGIARGRGRGLNASDGGNNVGKLRDSKLVDGDGLHMEFHEVHSSSDSDDGIDSLPELPMGELPSLEPDSPPRPFTLCPETGKILGQAEGEPTPVPSPEPQPEPEMQPQPVVELKEEEAEEILPDKREGSPIRIVPESSYPNQEEETLLKVEMSPGGTTGTVIESNVADPTAYMDTLRTEEGLTVTKISTANTSTNDTQVAVPTSKIGGGISVPARKLFLDSTSNNGDGTSNAGTGGGSGEMSTELVTITGEDGVVYQIATEEEHEGGETMLVSTDGEQQCVYVTAEQAAGMEDGSVLTLDTAVAEAVAQLMPDQVNVIGGGSGCSQFYVKEGDGDSGQLMITSGVEQAEETTQAQVVAQVVQEGEPMSGTGGTRRVVLLLPDGNLMMTEVDEEQYAALELDK